jgi:uncharacterized surface protein with fasciclin (FAS1) repeats
MLAEFSPCVPVRVMFGCMAAACRRVVTAPAGMRVFYRTTDFWEGLIMERVTRGRVRRVQVRLQRHACCAAHRASPATACLRCVFDACVLQETVAGFEVRCCALQRLHQARRGVHSRAQAAAAARVACKRGILESAENGDGVSVLCHLIAHADAVNKVNDSEDYRLLSPTHHSPSPLIFSTSLSLSILILMPLLLRLFLWSETLFAQVDSDAFLQSGNYSTASLC